MANRKIEPDAIFGIDLAGLFDAPVLKRDHTVKTNAHHAVGAARFAIRGRVDRIEPLIQENIRNRLTSCCREGLVVNVYRDGIILWLNPAKHRTAFQ